MTNPYDPQNPAKPDYFGGRKHILEMAIQRIEKALMQRQSGGIMVYGHRGVGKTSLVHKIMNLTDKQTNNEAITIYRRLGKTISDTELYQILTEELIEKIDYRKNLIDRTKDAAKKLKSIKAYDIEFAITKEFKQKSPFHQWRALIRDIKNVPFILIAIDDADQLSHEALGELKTIIEDQKNTPVLLLISGGIEFENKLVDDYSPIARAFSGAAFNLSEFILEETKEALEKPVLGTTTKWDVEAIHEVQELSRGYPYLVQCIASASHLDSGIITRKRVIEKIDAALKLGSPWLNHELQKASDHDINCFLRIVDLDKDIFKSNEMTKVGIQPVYISRLINLGVIEQINRGRYRLLKPPIVAFYHSLKRGLIPSINRKGMQGKLPTS
ncbi:MAG: ATP-binding protein [Candidatus Diapherotrites archaeon]|nr:ATP-binding protein [Candidatus Diapherotrites archaeon]MDZ4256057.1 ATP-binding protein [archaeon]